MSERNAAVVTDPDTMTIGSARHQPVGHTFYDAATISRIMPAIEVKEAREPTHTRTVFCWFRMSVATRTRATSSQAPTDT